MFAHADRFRLRREAQRQEVTEEEAGERERGGKDEEEKARPESGTFHRSGRTRFCEPLLLVCGRAHGTLVRHRLPSMRLGERGVERSVGTASRSQCTHSGAHHPAAEFLP